MRNVAFCMAALAASAVISVPGVAADGPVLADFEKESDSVFKRPPNVSIVRENARRGSHSLKISHPGPGYLGISFESGAQLRPIRERFRQYPLLCMDVFNPQDHRVVVGIRADDAKSADFGTRYNDGFHAPPGWSTLRVNLTGLTRSSSNNFSQREALDMATLRLFTLFTCPHGRPDPVVVYLDNIRMEGIGLPKVEGLMAFDFGPKKAAVFPGFQGVNEDTLYDGGRGFGWRRPLAGWHRRSGAPSGTPDDLGGDFGSGGAFLVDVHSGPGVYVVETAIDFFGDWGQAQRFLRRTVTLNGRKVHDETMDGETFLKERYLRYENDEDTPGMDIWESRVKPMLPVRTFEAAVGADGKLEISVATEGGFPGVICFMVAYPKAREAEGKAYMAALEKRRKEMFADLVHLTLPKRDNQPPGPTYREKSRGYMTFARTLDPDISCRSAPNERERGAPLVLGACPGEREAVQLGLLPLRKIRGVKVSATDLTGPGKARIPSSVIELRKVRNVALKRGYTNQLALRPFLLQPFQALTLNPALTRGIWITTRVPEDAMPGEYAGEVRIEAEGRTHEVPLRLTVHPIALEKADDVSISGMGTSPGYWRNWYPEFEQRWWALAEEVMRDQAEHGFNALTGGPDMRLKQIRNGKAEIDFPDADRWMALAAKCGLTMPGDSYQGMDVSFAFRRSSNRDCMAANEENARRHYGIGFGELIGIVYGAVEAHAREKGWPRRSYYLVDEPRPAFGNVDSCRQLIELHVKSAPGTRFSGYSDIYAGLLPVSISHHTEASLKACREADREAWTYGGKSRHKLGRWLFAARQKGLSGITVPYQYVNSCPYFDYSGKEGAWGVVFPSTSGVVASVEWERVAEGVDDYRYLKTLKSRIDAVKGKRARPTEVAAAERFLAETLNGITVGSPASANLKPEGWAAFRAALVRHLGALSSAGRQR